MAKKMVKCPYCQNSFDANSEETVRPSARRYAHKKCYEDAQVTKTKEQEDEEALYKYMKDKFKEDYAYVPLRSQVRKYIEQGYTYSGILKTLIYFFDKKGGSLEKSKGRIGIVPFVYVEASKYYKDVHDALQRNEGKDLNTFKGKERVITIVAPERKTKQKKLFDLEEVTYEF